MDIAVNQQIFEKKNSIYLYEHSHIRSNLTDWLMLEEDDFFYHIEDDMKKEELEKYLSKNVAGKERVILACANEFGVECWNRGSSRIKISITEIEEILRKQGYQHLRYFYPYPNCEFPMKIYSDEYLPKMGELRNNRMRNFGKNTYFLRDEEELFNRIIEVGKFREYSNAYVIVAEKEKRKKIPVFVQYANDRAPEFQMKTEIWKEDGQLRVIKKPMNKEALSHCERMNQCYGMLQREMEQTEFALNRCSELEDGLEFEFLKGKTLDEELKEQLQRGELESVRGTIQRFVFSLESMAKEPFEITESFEKVFGTGYHLEGGVSMRVTDIDLIFRNIILGKNWNVIDYEWSFDFPIPVRFVIYRAFEAFLEQECGNIQYNPYELCPMEEEEKRIYAKMEEHFQQYVSWNYHTLDEMYLAFGKPCLLVDELLQQKDEQIEQLRKQIADMEQTKVWRLYRKYRNWREQK